jgi:hypothetical protein
LVPTDFLECCIRYSWNLFQLLIKNTACKQWNTGRLEKLWTDNLTPSDSKCSYLAFQQVSYKFKKMYTIQFHNYCVNFILQSKKENIFFLSLKCLWANDLWTLLTTIRFATHTCQLTIFRRKPHGFDKIA